MLKCLCGGCEVWCCWLHLVLSHSHWQHHRNLCSCWGLLEELGGFHFLLLFLPTSPLTAFSATIPLRCCSWLFWWILGVLTALWHHELQHNKHMAIAWPVQLLFTSVSCRRKKITCWRCVITRKGAYGSFLILFFPQHEFRGAGNNSNSCSHFFCTVCFIHAVVFHFIQVKLLVWNELG